MATLPFSMATLRGLPADCGMHDSCRLAVDALPTPILIDLDMDDWVNLPEGRPRLPELLRMFLVEQQPAADPHLLSRQTRERAARPPGALVTLALRHLDHHRFALRIACARAQPDMVVAVIRRMAIGGLSTLVLHAEDVSS